MTASDDDMFAATFRNIGQVKVGVQEVHCVLVKVKPDCLTPSDPLICIHSHYRTSPHAIFDIRGVITKVEIEDIQKSRIMGYN